MIRTNVNASKFYKNLIDSFNFYLNSYSPTVKAAVAFSILTALILGVMVFLSHLISFVKIDYILRWLIPLCFSLLAVAVLFMVLTLSILGGRKNEDIAELIYSVSLFKATFNNGQRFFFIYEIFNFYF